MKTEPSPGPDAPSGRIWSTLAASRRWGGTLFAQVSTLGLVVVLAGLCGFALWSSGFTRHASERAIESSRLAEHYAVAAAAVAAEESLERKYRLEPGADVRRRFQEASKDLLGALATVRQSGGPTDRDVVDRVAAAHAPYLRAADRMFDAVDRADAREVLRIDHEEVDPRFDAIVALVGAATASHRRQQIAALAELQAREQFNEWATPATFLGGMALVVLFSGVLRRTLGQLDSQRRQAVHDALHDGLTGLPNRALLADRFHQALRASRRDGTTTGLLVIDLDRFKEVNDTLGHHVGDQLLARIGPKLVGALRDVDTVARLGGDEFAVLLPNVGSLEGALDTARRLRKALAEPVRIEGVELDIDASIGVVISGKHGEDAPTLLQHADVAMYVAKQQGRGVVAYDPGSDDHSPERLSLLGQLRRGIERGELFLHYQPKISLHTGAVTGVEALARWQHPERGLVSASDFISWAEHTGLIGPLTDCVLNLALAQARAWASAGHPIPIAVNVSARTLQDDDFANKIADLLALHGVPAALLEVEVTESAVTLEPERASRVLKHLHGLGVRIAIDDFGAGYTSLAQLKHLPISQLKIDKSFILTLGSDDDSALIVRSMIDLGHGLNLEVVAEGVESAQVLGVLAGYRCDIAQGFHVCRPARAEDLMQWYLRRADAGAAGVGSPDPDQPSAPPLPARG